LKNGIAIFKFSFCTQVESGPASLSGEIVLDQTVPDQTAVCSKGSLNSMASVVSRQVDAIPALFNEFNDRPRHAAGAEFPKR
jgi:hypothetical protein